MIYYFLRRKDMQETISTSSGSCVIGNATNINTKEAQKNFSKTKEQEGYYKIIISCLVASIFALAFVLFYQNYKIEKLSLINSINESGSKLNDDNFREVLFSMVHDMRNNTLENNKNIGKIEGILAVVTNQKPDTNDHSKIWHDGYYRGVNQLADISVTEYIRGYHAACDDLNCPSSTKDKAHDAYDKSNKSIFDLSENK
jgi:hypothetical protein